MIESTLEIRKIELKTPCYNSDVITTIIPPTERVRYFSPDEFEDFIAEWAISCASTVYKDVFTIGGSGDMGRDVIGEFGDGTYDYYQCKRYEGPLAPSEFWIEFGKLCYYTYKKAIPLPKKYYIIASQGLGPSMVNLIQTPTVINNQLIEQWDKKCRTKIKKGDTIELDEALKTYIKEFDFSIVNNYSMNKIIEEYMMTPYFYFRFGGSRKPRRNTDIDIPMELEECEMTYTGQILQVYSGYEMQEINVKNLKEYDKLSREFNRHRASYYSAESLRHWVREVFVNDDEFTNLKSEMLSGIIDFSEGSFKDDYERLRATMTEATKVNLSGSILDREFNFIKNDDRKGLCHHLVNDNEIEWVR